MNYLITAKLVHVIQMGKRTFPPDVLSPFISHVTTDGGYM